MQYTKCIYTNKSKSTYYGEYNIIMHYYALDYGYWYINVYTALVIVQSTL